MDLHAFLFWVLAGLTGLCAIMVVVTQNIVRSAAWLLFTLAGTAGVFFHLGADFVGATQLIVYVGGILVLVVFGVMLTAQGPFVTMRASAAEWAISAVVGLLLYGVLVVSMVAPGVWPEAPRGWSIEPDKSASGVQLGGALLGVREVAPQANVTKSGNRLITRQRVGYLLPFEIVSVHLLVVLIGAAYLARAKRRRGAAAPGDVPS
jgi:NADH-quinone oxidoreductase subunit J